MMGDLNAVIRCDHGRSITERCWRCELHAVSGSDVLPVSLALAALTTDVVETWSP